MKMERGNGGLVVPAGIKPGAENHKSDQQVIDMFMGGFFAYLRNNGIPTPDKGLARFVLYMNLFSDFKEMVRKNLESERQSMTADIMVAREAFGMYNMTRSVPPEVLKKTLDELAKQYAPQPPAPETKPPEGETNEPAGGTEEPEKETPAPDGNVLLFRGGEVEGKEEEHGSPDGAAV